MMITTMPTRKVPQTITLADLSDKMDAMNQSIQTLVQTMRIMAQRMDAMEQRMDAMEQRMDAMEQRIDIFEKTTRTGFHQIDQRLTAVENKIDLLQKEHTDLKTFVVNDLMDLFRSNDDHFDTIEERLETLETTTNRIDHEIGAFRNWTADHLIPAEQEIQLLRLKTTSIEEKLEAVSPVEADGLREEILQIKMRLSKLERRLEAR